MKKILLALLLFPVVASAGEFYLSPAKFQPTEPLKRGGVYLIEGGVNVSVATSSASFKVSAECIKRTEKYECGSSSIKFFPETFTLSEGGKNINVRIEVDKKAKNGKHEAILVITPYNFNSGTQVLGSLGTVIRYEVKGTMGRWERIVIWLKEHFNLMMANIGQFFMNLSKR